ncbi:LCP family protein [Streptomyces cavernicola]|uniref:LCP family protein n=1 Tax=Streptomyces cavernicola TaxID=3043613 RepID=A0ABT6SPA2_9ACTN|nr:LCP family protein [Streptomyces sp. B-S-A6]MDI3409076.1 LCP family protein [Streptomyces sp. B-S-A6]
MNDWPNRDQGYGRGSANPEPEGARVMRHVQRGGAPRPPAAPPRSAVPPQQGYGYDDGYSEGQVYGGGGRGGRGRGQDDGYYDDGYDTRPAPNWGRRIKRGFITLLVVVLVWGVGTYFWADGQLKREVDLAKVIERPGAGEGTNYLIVGSDSREGMTAADKKRLHTGSAGEGSSRTDSMMILHVGSNGDTLISLPRDSNVEIPSFVGSDSGKKYEATGRTTKLNAAYSEDGPELLVRTVEHNTGLRIDHYAEIGFGGFAKIVDAVGGVDIKVEQPMKDKKSGADFEPGTHTMNGEQSLAFVRQRYGLAGGDLDRTKNQQKFLSALANQTATPSTIINPFKLYPTMGAGLDTLVVDKDMSLFDLAEMFWAMKSVSGGEGKSMNMPVSGSVNGNLVWDKAKLQQLVEQLKNDEKVTVSDE